MKPSRRLGWGVAACVLFTLACGKKETGAQPPAAGVPPSPAAATQDAAPPPGDNPPAVSRPTDIEWILVRLGDKTITPNGLKQVKLHLVSGDKEARGDASCNTFRSRYELDEAGLRFGPLQVTHLACPTLPNEKRFLEAIQATSRWAIEGDRLILSDASGKPVAEFSKRLSD